ncbi:MAG: glycosyl hydrolase [Bacteroidetes bacterium]|nr:glycosyl hydrolase [Bacteroidota bacterium]
MKSKPLFEPPVSYNEAMNKADSLVAAMTTEEKIMLIGGADIFYTQAIERLGIKRVFMSDATMGVNLRDKFYDKSRDTTIEYNQAIDSTTSFPAAISLASTWNPDLARHYAHSIGEQCRAAGIGILLGPGMNMYRHAQCGRNFEYFGEDPFLAGKMIEQYVLGVQETGVIATLKHFVANNTDYFRRKSNSVVDERTLHEIYMPAFKAGIEAGAMAVMTAYNLVNGEWAGQSKYVIDSLLRKELGFKWLVMTDWWSVYDGQKVIESGQDIEMPYTIAATNAQELLASGKVQESDIDRMVKNIIATCVAMELYNKKAEPEKYVPRFANHENHALQTAREGIVLLKNKNNLLPIRSDTVKTILLTGKFTDKIHKGGGAAHVEGYDNISLSKACADAFGTKLKIRRNPGRWTIANADLVLLSVGTEDSEARDRPFELPREDSVFIQKVLNNNENTVVIVNSGGGIDMTAWNDKAKAILYAWYTGQNGNVALAEILAGQVNPSGKLPISIEKSFKDSPGYGYIPEGEELYTGWNDDDENQRDVYDIHYDEGVLIGYRWYDTKNIEPLYPFGFGLSYTSFEYDSLSLSNNKPNGDEEIMVSFTVKNTGSRAGKEIAQLYISDPESTVLRPLKELKNFAKIHLQPGEHKKITLNINKEDLSFWDPNEKKWTAESGKFQVLIGSSSRHIWLQSEFDYTNK